MLGTAESTARGERFRAYLEAALDCVIIADVSGRVVEFNPAAERTFGYTREEAVGRTLPELIVPPSLRAAHTRAFARFVERREQRLFGRRLELTGMRADGSEFPVELALGQVEGEPLLICGALRDLTDAKRAQDDLRSLADEQAALRRVATLVAQGSKPAEVFAAVAEGVAEILDVPAISMIRFEADASATKIAGWGESPFPVGERWALDDPSVMASVMQPGRPARIDDYASVAGAHAKRVREARIRSGVGAPIVVDGRSWGAVIAFATEPGAVTADAESRLARFTELVATAIANAQARDDLRQLADEQAALRRVATLIAEEATPTDVFSAVAKEAAQTLDVPLTALVRFEPDGTATQVGVWGRRTRSRSAHPGRSMSRASRARSGTPANQPASTTTTRSPAPSPPRWRAKPGSTPPSAPLSWSTAGRGGVMMALSTAQKPIPPSRARLKVVVKGPSALPSAHRHGFNVVSSHSLSNAVRSGDPFSLREGLSKPYPRLR